MPEHDAEEPSLALALHVRSFFASHVISERRYAAGPIEQRAPGFRVSVVGPGPKFPRWTYVTSGSWAASSSGGHGLEFVLSASADADRHIEVVAMAAYYHCGPESQRLDHGHTVPIGEGWTPGSPCDHLLVSLPYAYGPDLEVCAWRGGHARLLALLPITAAERALKQAEGLEALEARLEERAVDFSNPMRESVI